MADVGDFRWAARNGAKAAVRDRDMERDWSRPKSMSVLPSTAFRISSARRRRQAAERTRRMATRPRHQVQSRSAADPRSPARALRRQALVLASPLPDQGLSLSAHRSRQARRKGRRFRNRGHCARLHGARRSDRLRGHAQARFLRRWLRRGNAAAAGARGRAPASPISNREFFRELGLVGPATPIATTVHSSQVVADSDVVMEGHDSALHFIATELELIAAQSSYSQPAGVDWDKVRPDQFTDIPFLSALRQTIERRKRTT